MATCIYPDPSFNRLLTCLEQIRSKLDNEQDDLLFLYEYFRQPELKVHGSLPSSGTTKHLSYDSSGVSLAEQVCNVLVLHSDTNEDARELEKLLSCPHFKGLLQAHDGVVNGQVAKDDQEEKQVKYEGSPSYQGDSPHEHRKCRSTKGGFPEQDSLWTPREEEIEQELLDLSCQMQTNHWGLHERPEPEDLSYSVDVCGEDGATLKGQQYIDEEDDGGNEKEEAEALPVTPETLDVQYEESSECDKEISLSNEGTSHKQTKVFEETAPLDSAEQVHNGSKAIKLLKLKKTDSQPLGLTVKSEGDQSDIVVARILHGGAADKSGSVKVGDKIIEINNKRMTGLSTDEVVDMIDKISGPVHLKVVSVGSEGPEIKYEADKVYVRALFDFDPMRDSLIPCIEAGIPFNKGDVLQVLSQQDSNWWQAQRADDPDGEVGLIPSKEFQEMRQTLDGRASGAVSPTTDDRKNGRAADEVKLLSPYTKWKQRRNSKKGAKPGSRSGKSASKDVALSYEEVCLYQASQAKKRPVLLVGPPGVGRTELKRLLLMNDPQAFIATVPHTSRPMQPYETDGKDYHFVSRHTMERFIQDKKFIEVGKYKGCLYGTSKDSIKRAMKTGKTCIIKVHEEVLHLLRTADFMPFCVFVKPPSLGRLRSTRPISTKANPVANKTGDRSFKEEDLQKMISTAEDMSRDYGHLFDLTVVNDDLQETYELLSAALNRVANEQQWIPVTWLQCH